MTTKDGQMIPVHITTSDGQPVSTELSSAPLEIPVASDIVDESIAGLEFTTVEGQKFKIIPPYIEDTIVPDYLNIA